MMGAFILTLHVIAMMVFEELDLWTAIWLTTTTVTTVGYGDVTATTPEGQFSTMLLLYAGGVFIVAQGAGLFFEYRSERARLKQIGEWIWNMSGHIVIINTPLHNRTRFMERMIRELIAAKPSSHQLERFMVENERLDFLVITEDYDNGLPKALQALNVRLQAGRGDDPETLEDANIREARGVLVLATDPLGTTFAHDDALTFDTVHRVRETGYDGPLISEVINPQNHDRIRNAGASGVVMPVRAFPGLIARALFYPGIERVIESLFDSEGNDCVLVEMKIEEQKWADVIKRCVDRSIGTPIGYVYEGAVVTEPNLKDKVHADGIYVLTG